MKRILCTKKLSRSQKELLLNAGAFSLEEYNAIQIHTVPFEVPVLIENAIFTSQNAVCSIQNSEFRIQNCFCVGKKTKSLLEGNGQKVIKMTEYGSKLADFIVKYHKNETFYFFCGNRRKDDIPSILKNAKIELFEVKTYKTTLNKVKFDQKIDGILFFSPSGVESFTSENKLENAFAFCIGNTTAAEAKKHTQNVIVSNETTIESTILKAIETLKNYD